MSNSPKDLTLNSSFIHHRSSSAPPSPGLPLPLPLAQTGIDQNNLHHVNNPSIYVPSTPTNVKNNPSPDSTNNNNNAELDTLIAHLRANQIFDFLRLDKNPNLNKFLKAASKKSGLSEPVSKSSPTGGQSPNNYNYHNASNSPGSSPGPNSTSLSTYIEASSNNNSTYEHVLFSDSCLKLNHREKAQVRHIVITNLAIYNFKPNNYESCQRRILLTQLCSIVLSRCSDEILLQVNESYSYRLIIQHRYEAIQMIQKALEKANNNNPNNSNNNPNLLILFSEERELKPFVVTKEQAKVNSKLAWTITNNLAQSKSGTHSQINNAPFMKDKKRHSLITLMLRQEISSSGGGSGSSPASPSINSSSNSNSASPNFLSLNKATHARHGSAFSAFCEGVGAQFTLGRMEGWLSKKKGHSDKWDRKYFILDGQKLSYLQPRIKGNISLDFKIEAKHVPKDIKQGSTAAITFHDFRIVISGDKSRKEPLEIAAETRADMQRWLDAIELAMAPSILKHTSPMVTPSPSSSSNSNYQSLPPSPSGSGRNSVSTSTSLEGWLMKKEPGTDNWRRRYFMIVDGRLWYFEMILKGEIDCSAGVSAHSSMTVEPTEDPSRRIFAGCASVTRFAYRFNVSDSARIFYLAADSEFDMNAWIDAVQRFSTLSNNNGNNNSSSNNIIQQPIIELPSSFINSIEQEAPSDQVTFVFTDVQSSTNLWESAPDAMDLALSQHDDILRELLNLYRGYEVKTEGDAFMCSFFSPMDAVLWCMHTQLALNQTKWSAEFTNQPAAAIQTVTAKNENGEDVNITIFNGIRVRMGIHTGHPNCRRNPVTGRMDYFGSVVNRSARVSDTAHGGQVVCTQEVIDLITPLLPASSFTFTHYRKPSTSSITQALSTANKPSSRTPPQPPPCPLPPNVGTRVDYRLIEEPLGSSLCPIVTNLGSHSLKGISESVTIFQLMPFALKLRILPPIRTENNKNKSPTNSNSPTTETTKLTSSPVRTITTLANKVGSSSPAPLTVTSFMREQRDREELGGPPISPSIIVTPPS